MRDLPARLLALCGLKTQSKAASPAAHPVPDEPVYVVGDVHGRRDLLQELLLLIEADEARHGVPRTTIVFAGDHIDRGPESAEVLRMLRRLERGPDRRAICLLGNHDSMMLDALAPADPAVWNAEAAARWFRNGGDATGLSFGVSPAPAAGSRPTEDGLRRWCTELRAAIPSDLVDWLRARPLLWRSGNLVVVHATLDPDRAPDDQDPHTLLWGNPNRTRPRNDGLWFAHGHKVTRPATVTPGRIAVDTGACSTGELTAALIRPDAPVRFISTAR